MGEAIEKIAEAGGADPDTGRVLEGFDTLGEAIEAAKARSASLNEELQNLTLSSEDLAFQIEFERQVRARGITGVKDLTEALMAALIAKKLATKASDALTDAEERSFTAFKKSEAGRRRIDDTRANARDTIKNIEKANDVLRLRIQGLEREARFMEIRNELERRFGNVLLPKTVEEFMKAQLEFDRLSDKLQEVNEFKDILEDGFRDLGSTITDVIRTGEGAFEGFVKVLNRTLEAILDLIIQLIIINPLLNAMDRGNRPTDIGGLTDIVTGAAGFIGGLFGGGSGSGVGALALSDPGFAHGGGFTVGGAGGIDDTLVKFRATRGEKVEVTPAGEGSNENMTVINFNFPPGTNVKEFGDAQSQIAAMLAGTLSSASASNS